jgi:hypothetical protein
MGAGLGASATAEGGTEQTVFEDGIFLPGAFARDLIWHRRVSGNDSGDGVFGSVSYIQRMNTFGGAAPTTPRIDGEKLSVPYNANYIFWRN